MMRRLLTFVLALISAILAASPVLAAALPSKLYSRNPNLRVPIWVSASEAIRANGDLKPELFQDRDREVMRNHLETKRSEERRARSNGDAKAAAGQVCFGESPAEIFAPDETLGDLVRSSRGIYAGSIEAIDVGFFEGVPASILTVRIEAMPIVSPEYKTGDGRIRVYYPSAAIRVGDEIICTRPAMHTARPRVGDRILAFAITGPVDTAGLVLYPQASRHLIFETSSGQLILPDQLQHSLAGFSSISDLITSYALEDIFFHVP